MHLQILPAGATYAQLFRALREQLRDGNVPDWEASAEWLITDVLGCTRTELFSRSDAKANEVQIAQLAELAARRLRREPVQYIVGYTEFCGLRLHVDPRVLIPRPETELLVAHLVEAASRLDEPIRILDVGTGSGCIALGAASLLPEAEIWGVDASEDALDVARANASALGLNVRFTKMNALAPEPLSGSFSIVVSNPPYIPASEIEDIMPEVVSHEPHRALFVDGDPLVFYRSIIAFSESMLRAHGYLFFEVNPDYAAQIEQLLKDTGRFPDTGVLPDLAERERIVWGRHNG